MPSVPETAATPLPRRGRLWVILVLSLGLAALSYALYSIATKEAGREVVRIEGIGDAQRLLGGLRQEGDRLGSPEAPVAIQVFNDMQCGNCRDEFLSTVPALAEDYVRPGEAKLLMRHYSVAANPLELSFFGAEAAAEQSYGWQYTYLFFRNQGEARRFGIGDRLLESLAASIGELDIAEWRRAFDQGKASGSTMAQRLQGYEELGRGLGIRAGQAMVVSGPRGTRTLQDGPSLARIERAIEAVR